jgi:hypothetical protein
LGFNTDPAATGIGFVGHPEIAHDECPECLLDAHGRGADTQGRETLPWLGRRAGYGITPG